MGLSQLIDIPWQLRFLLATCAGNILGPYLIKILAGRVSRIASLTLQYALIASVLGLVSLKFSLPAVSSELLLIAGLGVANSFACYAQWRAYDISLSRASTFASGHDLISLILGVLILGDKFPLTPSFLIGVSLIMLAMGIMTYQRRTRARLITGSGETSSTPIGIWIAIYVVIWGVVGFLMRYFATNGLPPFSFGIAFYFGSFVGAVLLASFSVYRGYRFVFPARQDALIVGALSILVMISTLASFWTLAVAPLTIVKPLEQITGQIFPLLAGLILFGEHKQLNKATRCGIVIGATGGLLLALP